MKAINTQTDVYLNEPERLTHKSKQFIEIIVNKADQNLSGHLLDIGCGSGSLIKSLSTKLKRYNFTGFDVSEDLMTIAKKLNENTSSNFLVGDFNSIEFDKKFNIICASGVLSIFQEFEAPLKKWLSWLTDDGFLFICGRFNSRDVDTQILFKNNFKDSNKWEGGLSAFSVKSVSNFLIKLGYKCEFKKFNLPIDIKEDTNNPLRTFTKELKNGDKLVMDGANIVAEYFFLTIRKNLEN